MAPEVLDALDNTKEAAEKTLAQEAQAREEKDKREGV
jgi:hypothetical protein